MKVTTKGQVTIPSDLRKLHGIRPNSEVEFVDSKNGIIIRPKKADQKGLDKKLKEIRGILKGKITTDKLIKLTREK